MSDDLKRILEQLDRIESQMITKDDMKNREVNESRRELRTPQTKKIGWKVWKWVVGIISLVIVWTLGGAIFSILLSNSPETERYSGLFGLAAGIVVLLLIASHEPGKRDEQ